MCADTASTRLPPSRLFRGVTRPPWLPSVALGVGHIPVRAIVSSDGRTAAPGDGLWLYPYDATAGVGNHEDPVTSVRGADGCSGYAVPLRVIPDLGQVAEYVSHPSSKQAWDVLQDREPGS